jgi:Family of unknown function (DUF5675)
MKLVIQRDTFTDNSTTGELSVDGAFLCYTLEPRSDQSEGKPYAIPQGTYPVTLEMSAHFKEVTPHLQNVPGFTEIEIHPGNWPSDTEGCTIVGASRGVDMVGSSRLAFGQLMEKLQGQTEITATYIGGALP